MGPAMMPMEEIDKLLAAMSEKLDAVLEANEELSKRVEALEGTAAPGPGASGGAGTTGVIDDSPQPEGEPSTETTEALPGEMSRIEDAGDYAGEEDPDDPGNSDKRPGDGSDKAVMSPFQRLLSIQDGRRN